MTTPQKASANRRRVITTAIAGAAFLVAPKAIAGQNATPDSGEWTFTDDKGVTVTLPSRPERVAVDVNAAAPLWDFGIAPTALFGWNVLADGTFGDAGGNIDGQGIAVVGDVNEPIKLEELIASEPDLVITLTWTPDDPADYWSMEPDLVEQVAAVAPIVALSATGRADENTIRFAELAAALGADLNAPEIIEAEEEFHAAMESFSDVAEATSDLSVLFFAPVPETAYIANPTDWADLNMYQELGINIVAPDVAPGDFWESISHEQALKYPADVIFISTRSEAFSAQEVKDSPTWSQHPAVEAGQIYPWNQDFIMSYPGMTDALNQIAENMSGANKVT